MGTMVRKGIFALIWFQATILVLIFNLSYLSALQKGKEILSSLQDTTTYPFLLYTPSASSGKILETSVTSADARPLLLTQFIRRYQPNSPLLPFADLIVRQADENNLDFRLITAIAMCESNLGVRIPKRTFNAWGIAVYTTDLKGKQFDSWEHAITWVSRYVGDKYYKRGITDLYAIGAIWAPPSVDNEYSWTRCVEKFMYTIQ